MEVLKDIVVCSDLNDNVGIRIDYVVLTTHARFEILFAANVENENRVYILELLPWETVKAIAGSDFISYEYDDISGEVLHPSYQAIGYKSYVEKNSGIVGNRSIKFESGVYLYECNKTNETDICTQYEEELLKEAEIFYVNEEEKIFPKLRTRINGNNGINVLNILHQKDQLCAAGMDAYLGNLFGQMKSKAQFGLYEDQKHIVSSIYRSMFTDQKEFFLVNVLCN